MTPDPYPRAATLADALTVLNERFKCISFDNPPLRPADLAPNERPYVEILSGGLVERGVAIPVFCLTEASAVQTWLDAVLRYGYGGSTLYWRIEPELGDTQRIHFPGTAVAGWEPVKVFIVYSRLVIA